MSIVIHSVDECHYQTASELVAESLAREESAHNRESDEERLETARHQVRYCLDHPELRHLALLEDNGRIVGFAAFQISNVIEMGRIAVLSDQFAGKMLGGFERALPAIEEHLAANDFNSLSITLGPEQVAYGGRLVARGFVESDWQFYYLETNSIKVFRLIAAAQTSLPEGYTFRWATEDDVPEVCTLMVPFLTDHKITHPPELVERIVRRRLRTGDAPDGILLMHDPTGLLQAATNLTYREQEEGRSLIGINDYIVRPESQRGGLGGALFAEILRMARERGVPLVCGEVSSSNPKALNFWNKNARRHEGTARIYFKRLNV
ncbi:MAG: GNAT family N-acetyltransferase [Myxococcales bacterium]|nr:GNAT family N-acetyltransferase [Myxococcales bacterium]